MKLAAVLLTFAVHCAGDTILQETNVGGIRQKSIRLSPGPFTPGTLERLAKSELKRFPFEGFRQIIIYGGRGAAPLPKPHHYSYDYWRELHESLAKAPNEIGELVSVGNNAVLRMRDLAGRTHRKVLSGEDPLLMETEAHRIEILYFSFSSPSPYILQRVDVFIRTDGVLSEATGLALLRKWQPIFPAHEVTVRIRNDQWFVYEPTYPFVNPFVIDSDPPRAAQYGASNTLVCSVAATSQHCRLD